MCSIMNGGDAIPLLIAFVDCVMLNMYVQREDKYYLKHPLTAVKYEEI